VGWSAHHAPLFKVDAHRCGANLRHAVIGIVRNDDARRGMTQEECCECTFTRGVESSERFIGNHE
jgi:hypothetical protein